MALILRVPKTGASCDADDVCSPYGPAWSGMRAPKPPVAGVDFVGALPPALQNKTDFLYVAGVLASSTQPSAAKSLIGFISGPEAPSVLKAKGLEPG